MVVPVHAPLSWPRACSDMKGRRWPEYGGGARDPRVLDAGGRQEVELGWETSPKGGRRSCWTGRVSCAPRPCPLAGT
jgi:hypothetical protein